ncbi:cytochrome P450 [Mycena latifolia]|nr:cytochrome P450 [Mycena latifolia]
MILNAAPSLSLYVLLEPQLVCRAIEVSLSHRRTETRCASSYFAHELWKKRDRESNYGPGILHSTEWKRRISSILNTPSADCWALSTSPGLHHERIGEETPTGEKAGESWEKAEMWRCLIDISRIHSASAGPPCFTFKPPSWGARTTSSRASLRFHFVFKTRGKYLALRTSHEPPGGAENWLGDNGGPFQCQRDQAGGRQARITVRRFHLFFETAGINIGWSALHEPPPVHYPLFVATELAETDPGNLAILAPLQPFARQGNLINPCQRVPSFHADDVKRFYTSLDQLIHALAPGAYPPFDLFPVLKYLPAPLTPWRSVGRQVEAVRTGIHTQLYNDMQRRQAAGDEESDECFITRLFQSGVPARARREIDAVVGGTRLPILVDFPKLPFIDAVIKECLRFRPQFPTGVPHLMTADTFFKDYIVPKGAVVVLNTFMYGVFHDPEIVEDPEVFNPDRFLNSEHGTLPGMDTDFRDNLLFGGGRLVFPAFHCQLSTDWLLYSKWICPGQWLGRTTMQLTAMRLLWAFKFGVTIPITGAPISRDLNFYYFRPGNQPHEETGHLTLIESGFSVLSKFGVWGGSGTSKAGAYLISTKSDGRIKSYDTCSGGRSMETRRITLF